jgi:U3 small nucleolar RNA-associated protein 12
VLTSTRALQGASEVARTIGVAGGNRSDVRAIALSHDDALLLTTGNGGTKVWNPATGACVNSIESGYGLTCLFAPGGRFAVLGCKDGKLDLIDLGSATVVERVDAHSGQVRYQETNVYDLMDARVYPVCASCPV